MRIPPLSNSLQNTELDGSGDKREAADERIFVSDCLLKRKQPQRVQFHKLGGYNEPTLDGEKRLVPGAGIEPARPFRDPGF